MKSTISIHQLKNTVINKSYAIPEALDLINNRLGNEYFSLADLLDSIKHEQLRTVIYMTGYFSWLNKNSFISSIGGKKYNLPIDYSTNDFLCSEKSIKKKVEESDHIKYEMKSLYFSIDLDIDNPSGEMHYMTNYGNNIISVPLRTKSTWKDVTPQLLCSFDGFFELPSSQYKKNSLYIIKNNKFPLNDISWLHAVDDECIPVQHRFSVSLIHENIKLGKKSELDLEILDLSQIEILQEDFIKFIINQNIAKKLINVTDSIDEQNQIEKLQKKIIDQENKIHELNKEIDKLKKESPNNNMKIFIKSLICILFDYETAQNPRKIIMYDKKYGYGSTGVLQKKFDNYEDKKKTNIKGIRSPITGDTLEDWIKNVDVEFIKE